MIDLLDSPIIVQSFLTGPTTTYRFLVLTIISSVTPSTPVIFLQLLSLSLSPYPLPPFSPPHTAAISVGSSRTAGGLAVLVIRWWCLFTPDLIFFFCLFDWNFRRCLDLSIGLPGHVSDSAMIFSFFPFLSFLRVDLVCCVFVLLLGVTF